MYTSNGWLKSVHLYIIMEGYNKIDHILLYK